MGLFWPFACAPSGFRFLRSAGRPRDKKQTTVPKRSKKLVCMAYSLVWLSISTFIYYSAADRGAEYCDERVCLSVSLSVCVFVRLSAIISSELHVLSSPNSVHVICGSSSGLLWRRNDT